MNKLYVPKQIVTTVPKTEIFKKIFYELGKYLYIRHDHKVI